MKQKIDHLNKVIIQVLILTFIYQELILLAMTSSKIYELLQKHQYNDILLEILYFFVGTLFGTTILIYYPFFFLSIFIIFWSLSKINKPLNNVPGKLFTKIGKALSGRINKYIAFYLLTFFSFMIFITLGIYLPIWVYESIFQTPAFFAARDAMHFIYNYESAIKWGIPGMGISFIILLIIKFVFKKEFDVDKFRLDLIDHIKKLT